jgi:hypothetical protein
MSTNVFDSQETNPPATPEQEQVPQHVNVFADQLSTITNEDGKQKYDTVDKALEALKHSQSFIPTLQSEKTALENEVNTLREQVAQAKGVQDVMDTLANRQNEQAPNDQQVASLSAEDVAKLVTQQLNQRNTADTHQTNTLAVDKALKEKFGTEATAQVIAKAKELGTTPKDLGELAAKSPAMVLALFGTQAKQTGVTPTSYNFDNTPQEEVRVTRPAKSIMFGSTTKETTDFMKQIRDEVYRDLEVKVK